MTIENDIKLIQNAVIELNKSNAILRTELEKWSETITAMHQAELHVRSAHRGVLKAETMLSHAIHNNLGAELDELLKHKQLPRKQKSQQKPRKQKP